MKKILLTIHQLPQIILSRLVTHDDDVLIHKVGGVSIYKTKHIEGLSLGDRIFVSDDAPEGTWLVKHEFGHVIQSRVLGWLYIPIIVIPSYLWYKFFERFCKNEPVESYYFFFTEYWANKLVWSRK